MKKHAPIPSIDLEGGESHRVTRRPSVLSIRTDQNLRQDSTSYPSPTSPSSAHSPSLSPGEWTASPILSTRRHDSPGVNYFSTLPPSPPRSGHPSPPHHLAHADLPALVPLDATSSYPVTPPDSARPNKSFTMSPPTFVQPPGIANEGVNGRVREDGAVMQRANSGGQGSTAPTARLSPAINLLSVQDDEGDQSSKVKRRPSLILTEATDTAPQVGLALGMDASAPLSPRLGKRQYPTSPSTASTPTSEYFPSPVSSPVSSSFPAFLSPALGGSSPTLPSHIAPPSPKLGGSFATHEPPSPRLAAFAEPFTRLVRRASSTSLNASTDLPTSVSRSPSPSRSNTSANSSPNLSVGTASPALNARRRSFAAEARDKEDEKKRELQERSDKDKEKKVKMHMRMFSWAERPEDRVANGKNKAAKTTKRGNIVVGRGAKVKLFLIALVVIAALWWAFTPRKARRIRRIAAGRNPNSREDRVRLQQALADRVRLRRSRHGGKNFIHPDVINRPAPPKPLTTFQRGIKWIRHFFVIDSRPLPQKYQPGAVTRSRNKNTVSSNTQNDAFPTQIKTKNIFVPAQQVPWRAGTPLPPAPEHNDVPERDTLVLYRILGNDLPPRHSPGQTLRNLRFLLQHESDFSALPHLGPHRTHHAHAYGSGSRHNPDHSTTHGLRVDKYFVLNRIAEPEIVSAIIGLLHTYSVPNSRILIIPFEFEEYAKRSFKWDGGVESLLGWGIGPQDSHPLFASEVIKATPAGSRPTDLPSGDPVFGGNHPERDELKLAETSPEGEEMESAGRMKKKQDMLSRLRAMDYTYHEKNLYAMNNNGGRNYALSHGRSLPNARWILPLDGNSFLTPAAMYSIVKTLSISGEGPSASRYLVIPMARLLDNFDVVRNNSIRHIPFTSASDLPSLSASHEAEQHHRPEGAPETPEEPQVGFRYDSTETYQEAMRYGRRSKLELLWRLGAVPYARGLDTRTLPWETSDRLHVTKDTWGSIPGALGTNASSKVHQPHGDFKPWSVPNPERGPLAYAKAGWVYRLFSGDRSQEEPSPEATQRRSINRIKGIVAFLEHLDEDVARGHAGCGPDFVGRCGYHQGRLWNFDVEEVERLRQKYKSRRRDAVEKVDAYEDHVYKVYNSVSALFTYPEKLAKVDAEVAAKNATVLAMAAYITGNATYSHLAANYIQARFVRKVSIFHRQNDHRQQMTLYKQVDPAIENAIRDAEDDFGYAFPPPPKGASVWSTDLAEGIAADATPGLLPFEPLNFDPSYLFDSVRLLQSPNAPPSDIDASDKALDLMATALLNHLLFSSEAIAFCRNPPARIDGASFDAKVASVAAYLDDVRLLGRVANRARLRLPPHLRGEGMMQNSLEVRHLHRRLLDGLSNINLVPYSLVEQAPIADLRGQVRHNGKLLVFSLLGL